MTWEEHCLQWIRKEETAREGCRENALKEFGNEAKGYRDKHYTKLRKTKVRLVVCLLSLRLCPSWAV